MHRFVETHLKVWSVKPSQTVLPTLLPWIEESLDGMCYMRTDTEEGTVLWINLPNVGVVTSLKRDFFFS